LVSGFDNEAQRERYDLLWLCRDLKVYFQRSRINEQQTKK